MWGATEVCEVLRRCAGCIRVVGVLQALGSFYGGVEFCRGVGAALVVSDSAAEVWELLRSV